MRAYVAARAESTVNVPAGAARLRSVREDGRHRVCQRRVASDTPQESRGIHEIADDLDDEEEVAVILVAGAGETRARAREKWMGKVRSNLGPAPRP